MQVVIIGSGNTATVLGKLLKENGFHICQVISRNIIHAEILANELNCPFGDFSSSIDETADMYLKTKNLLEKTMKTNLKHMG